MKDDASNTITKLADASFASTAEKEGNLLEVRQFGAIDSVISAVSVFT